MDNLIKDEIIALAEEGYDVSSIDKSYKKLKSLLIRNDFKYVEPIDLEQISLNRPKKRFDKTKRVLNDRKLYQKIYGGWMGRCAGCLLGKPVESWTKEKIEDYLVILMIKCGIKKILNGLKGILKRW